MGKDISASEKERVISFFVRQQHKGKFPVKFLSKFYPLNEKLLEFYEDYWDWKEISFNESIDFTHKLLEKYEEKLDWYWLTCNKNLYKSEKLLQTFSEKISWYTLSYQTNVDFSPNILSAYSEELNWQDLSENPSVELTPRIVQQFAEYWDISKLSSHPKLKNFDDLFNATYFAWDWSELSVNKSFDFTIELIEKYAGYWDWSALSANPKLPLSAEFISHFQGSWDWSALSGNPALPLAESFIENFYDFWDWSSLCENSSLPISSEFIRNNFDKIDFQTLSANTQSINPELITEFEDYWDWKNLARNRSVILTPNLIEKFHSKTNVCMLVENPTFPMEYKILNRYKDEKMFFTNLSVTEKVFSTPFFSQFLEYWDWENLSKNQEADFTFDILEKYEDLWDFEAMLWNNSIFPKVFVNILNDEMIFEIMETFYGEEKKLKKSLKNITVEEREKICIERSREYKRLKDIRLFNSNEFYIKENYAYPVEKSFSQFWEMYGFEGNGIGNRNSNVLTMDEMEEYIFFCFEVLYVKQRKILEDYLEDMRQEWGKTLENLRKSGLRISFAHPTLSLPANIQAKFGNYA